MKTPQKVYIASAPSGIHLGNCYLGASYDKETAKRMAGRRGYVYECQSLEDALELYSYWHDEILSEI